MIKIIDIKDKEKIKQVLDRKSSNLDDAILKVRPIIKDVKIFGDKALIDYTKKFDCFDISKNTIQISRREIKEAYKKVDQETIRAIGEAAKNIEEYCKEQLPKEWKKELKKGIVVGQLIRPLDKVGCYVPAGRYALPSSVLMTVIPAKVAGVKEIIVCSPPKADNEGVFVAADIAGADKIFGVGGAQAIAAMAYGTGSIPKVNKIVGPGNIFVTAAKKEVYGDVGIDFLAGPSEILILATKGNPKFIAADMLSQAEHDRMSSAILITNKKELAKDVKEEIVRQLKRLKTKDIAEYSIKNNSAIIISKNIDEAVELVNDIAPEHLEVMTDNDLILEKLNNFGAMFYGEYSSEAVGDYASGPNHVLPTGAAARFTSGLSVYDFLKMPTYQSLTKDGLEKIKETVIKLASIEGLDAHKRSVEVRFEDQ